jgi:23S rRNA (uracil1939-C5)-methyltransferase
MPFQLTESESTVVLQIEKLVHGGKGLAHQDSLAVFVPRVLPGETVRVLVNRPRKGFAEGQLVEIVTPSADRVAPLCRVYGQCGGCQLQHTTVDAQLELKRAILTETLARVGGLHDVSIPPIVPSPENFGYRSRARFAVLQAAPREAALAYHEEASGRLIAIGECPVLAPSLNAIVAHLNNILSFSKKMSLQEVSLAASSSGAGEVVIHYLTERATRADAEAWFEKVREGGLIRGQALLAGRGRETRRFSEGDSALTEVIAGCTLRITHGSFAQANWKLNAALGDTVKHWAFDRPDTSPLRVLELYAGIGNFGLPIAREGALVTLVEGNRLALADAKDNAKVNHVGRCRFRAMSAEAMLAVSAAGEYDLVIVDPPRTGLSKEALAGLIRLRPPRILYVSCDPATLARDLRAIVAADYRIARLQAYDMFPQTMHMETVVELVGDPPCRRI